MMNNLFRNQMFKSFVLSNIKRSKHTNYQTNLNPSFKYELKHNDNIRIKNEKLKSYQERITFMYNVHNTVLDEDNYLNEMSMKLALKN